MMGRGRRLVVLGAVMMLAALGGCADDDGPRFGSSVRGRPDTKPQPPITVPPELGPTVRADVPPPPLSGGTIAVAPDQRTVVAADPDRDRVYVVDLDEAKVVHTVVLDEGDEPGRVVVDGSGRAHVALRRGGAVVTIALATGAIVNRRRVCVAPRGIAHDPVLDRVYVACKSGELASFAATMDGVMSVRMIRKDLRDVIAKNGKVVVSTFRDAAILDIADDAAEPRERRRAGFLTALQHRIAWRMVKAAPPTQEPIISKRDDVLSESDDIVVSEQSAPDDSAPPVGSPAEYYRPTPVEAPAEYYRPDPRDQCPSRGPGGVVVDVTTPIQTPMLALPVDVAADEDGSVVVAAGNAHTPALAQLVALERSARGCAPGRAIHVANAQLTSVALARHGRLVVALSREPAALVLIDRDAREERQRIVLSDVSRDDTGFTIFHSNAGSGVACASCHAEGSDDGHSWLSAELGPRRTPSLLGTLAGTAPYHWNGEAEDIAAIADLTFRSRMLGPELTSSQTDALGGWLTALPAPPSQRAADAVSAARGKALFEREGRCATCHAGPMHTNNETVNAIFPSQGAFQVPSLVGVAWRAPYTHDGSAPTIQDLLTRGHGGGALSTKEIADVVGYVETF